MVRLENSKFRGQTARALLVLVAGEARHEGD
jgi:hypothetical protein